MIKEVDILFRRGGFRGDCEIKIGLWPGAIEKVVGIGFIRHVLVVACKW